MADKPDHDNITEEAAKQEQPEEMVGQLAKIEDKFLRASAELENVRKRSLRDVENARKYALENCLSELTLVLDSMEKAIQAASSDLAVANDATTDQDQGIELCYKLMLSTLEKFGVKQLNPLGEAFNPNEHEATAMIPSPDAAPGIVLEVLQSGYLLNDRTVRAAKVVVSQVVETPQPDQSTKASKASKAPKAKRAKKPSPNSPNVNNNT